MEERLNVICKWSTNCVYRQGRSSNQHILLGWYLFLGTSQQHFSGISGVKWNSCGRSLLHLTHEWSQAAYANCIFIRIICSRTQRAVSCGMYMPVFRHVTKVMEPSWVATPPHSSVLRSSISTIHRRHYDSKLSLETRHCYTYRHICVWVYTLYGGSVKVRF